MLQTAISKPLLQKAAADLQNELPFSVFHHLIQKGRDLSRQGLVYNVIVIDSEQIEGKVVDTAIHDVALNLADIIHRHSCPCGTEGLCSHVLALFFYVHGNVLDNGKLLRQWKQAKKKPPQNGSPAPHTATAEPTESIDEWWKRFAKIQDEFAVRHRRRDDWPYRLAHQLFPALVKGGPKHRAVRLLYRFHAGLFLLHHLIEYGKERGWNRGLFGSYGQFSWRQDVQYIADELLKTLEQFSSNLAASAPGPLIEQTAPYVRDLLRIADFFPSLIYDLYTVAWELLFTTEAQRRQEKERLLRLAEEEQIPLALLAAAHFAFLLEEDEEALALYRTFPEAAAPFLIGWIERLITSYPPDRFASFWAKGKEELPSYLAALRESERINFVNEIGRLYEVYAQQNNQWDEYETFLRQCFPYTANRYVQFLHRQGRYQHMIELYLWANMTAHDMDPQFLKGLEKRDPMLVLPLYHRAVMQFVQAKNRPSYRMAVRYLKKLRTCYRSLKQMNEWNAYLEQLCAKTARMRAFHEELQKGKLLP
ncbi:SWIM zinc finger family protein [Geobacillus subterraneus]|uniref:SWIM zinc finger family protein n=1 Tax=Geobacillus subterraneus TaxID=129338 RepID=UPI0016091BDC